MNLGFYSAAASAYYQQQRLNVIGNNTANIGSVGYKSAQPSFSELLSTHVDGADGGRLARGAGARMEKADTDFSQGGIFETYGQFDYAIQGDGFFALRNIETGEISYTRAGNFQMAERNGQYYLTDTTGKHFVLGQNQQPIVAARNEAGVVDLKGKLPVGIFTFPNKNGMQHLGDGRFTPIDKNGQVQPGTGELMQGWLEASNTDLVSQISKVIEAQRAFSYALTMVRTQDEVESTINGLRA